MRIKQADIRIRKSFPGFIKKDSLRNRKCKRRLFLMVDKQKVEQVNTSLLW